MRNFFVRDILAIPRMKGVGTEQALDREVQRISTDTRTIQPGDVFLALRGKNFDGHAFIEEAIANGAFLCIVENKWFKAQPERAWEVPFITVTNGVQAYGKIARAYRDMFDIPVIGITGSNGKTTTKELVTVVLATKYCVHATSANYNNQIGVPKTLLELDESHEVAVIEMGTNQPGDIQELCDIAAPTIGVITNTGKSHLAKLHSREQVAEEKLHLLESLPENGLAALNADDRYIRDFQRNGMMRISFGYADASDVRIRSCTLNKRGNPAVRFYSPAVSKKEFLIQMKTVGMHSAYAAAIALAIGTKLDCAGYKMKEAIQHFTSPAKRMNMSEVEGITIIDDTYNANPDSVKAAIDTLAAMNTDGERILVLGDMLELGTQAAEEHREIGKYAAYKGLKYILTYGKVSKNIHAHIKNEVRYIRHFTDKTELTDVLLMLLEPGDAVLVKGSRGVDLTVVVNELKEKLRVAQEV